MSYGPFESLEASESEHRIASNAVAKDLDRAIAAVKLKHSRYLNNAQSQDDFYGRVANVKDDMRKIVQSFGILPAKSPMRKVVASCKNDARPLWLRRQAAEGTSVDDVAPSPATTAPVGTLEDSPVGAVLGRRTAAAAWDAPDSWSRDVTRMTEDQDLEGRKLWERNNAENPSEEERLKKHYRLQSLQSGSRRTADDMVGYESQPYVPQDVTSGEMGTGVLATHRVGGGFRDFLQQGVRGLAEGLEPEATGGGWRGELARGFDEGIEGELPPELARPQHPPLPKGHGHHDWKQEGLEGLQSGIGQGLRGASFQQVLAEADRMSGGGLADAPALIPEGSFDSYLNSVTGEETSKAQSHPFGSREGDDNWVNTAARRVHGAEDYAFGGKDQYDFTGSPETQHHHRALPEGGWAGLQNIDADGIYELMDQGMSLDEARASQMKGAAVVFADWAHDNGYHAGSARTAMAWGHRVGAKQFSHLLHGVGLAQGIRRTAAGKDHLTTSQDAITKMLNELAEDFQKSIMPLQDALQSVQFAQQSMQAQQSPMNVMPPGSVNVMPEGMGAPAGGAPMQGQSMPAQPGPGGLSPMVDPSATGGAPAPGADPAAMGGDPAAAGGAPPGGDPAAGGGGLPPEIMQVLQQIPPEVLLEVAVGEMQAQQGGGGAPAPGGDPAAAGGAPPPGEPAQRPTASSNPLRPLGKKKEWYEDDDDDDDESDPNDGFGGKKAPPFGKKDASYGTNGDLGPELNDLKQRGESRRQELLQKGRGDIAQMIDPETGEPIEGTSRLVSRRYYAGENPFAGGDGPPKKDDSDEEDSDKGDDEGPPKEKSDGPPEHGDGPPPGPPPPGHGDGGGDPIEALPEFQAFCEANKIPYPDLGPEDQEEVKAVFIDVIQQLQGGGGEQGPPQGPPPGPPPEQQGPPPEVLARRQANAFLKWAKYYDLPVNAKTASYFVSGGDTRGRRPLAR